ncbi:MAG: Mu transposase C-terminal domain-containing protein, partial [Tepidisphaeraceae bacterium]
MSIPEPIDLDTAAARSGKSVGHLRRLCKDVWAAQGTAELRRDAGGGKPQWLISPNADPSLAVVKFREQIGLDLHRIAKPKRKEAMRRLCILNEWKLACLAAFTLGYDKRRATNHFCERQLIDNGVKVSRRTLYYWERQYDAGGLAGLVDGRGGNAAERSAADPFLAEVQRLYLSTRQPKLTLCREMAAYTARERGWALRTYKACQRHIEKIPAAVIYKLRGGEEAYVNHAEPFLERDTTTLASNELWNADHHQFDVIVTVAERTHTESGEVKRVLKRPWVTAFQDVRSRKIVGWTVYAHDPNSDVIFSVFRAAVIANGVPAGLLIDNGKDFDCADFTGETKKQRIARRKLWTKRKVHVELDERRGLFPALEIDVTHAQKYHGQSKWIERWFGFVETRTTVWDTYCGNSTATKPEDLQEQIDRGRAPTLADFAAWFDEWVNAYNAGHNHGGQGMDDQTPDQVYNANLATKRTARRELLDVLCMKRVPARVHQNGVRWGGLNYGQYEPSLQRLLDTEVFLRVDERDVTRVQVYDPADRFLCIAPANQSVPANASAQLLREAMKEKRRDRKLRTD